MEKQVDLPSPRRVLPRRLGLCALLLILLWAAFLLLSTLTALIPRSAVETNMSSTADYYRAADMFQLQDPDDDASVIHNFADAVLFNILWSQDSERPFYSALNGSLYQSHTGTQGEMLYDAVTNDRQPNTSYARYWHGSLVALKPLLCVTDIAGVRIVNAVLLAVLAAAYFALLLRRRRFAVAIGSALGLAVCRIWLVPLCLEYYSCFFLMFLFSDIILLRGERLKRDAELFIVMGALTCFFDFLTCEILTLGMPLVCLLLVKGEGGRPALRRAARCCAAWLIAYAATWVCKWGLSAAVLEYSLYDVALGQGVARAAGVIDIGVDIGFQPLAAVCVNLSCIFPFNTVKGAGAIWVMFFAVCLAIFCVWFLYRRPKGESIGPAPALWLLALVPFARYMIVSNHSALHPFFTCRDLLLSFAAVSAALGLTLKVRRRGAKPKKSAQRAGRR